MRYLVKLVKIIKEIKEAINNPSLKQDQYIRFTLLMITIIAIMMSVVILVHTFNEIKAVTLGISDLASSLTPTLPERKVNSANVTVIPESQKNQPEDDQHSWQPLHSLLASSTARRKDALQQLHLSKGEHIIACFSIKCSDCEREAIKLNSYTTANSIVGIAVAPQAEINQWRKKLSLGYPVVSVSETLFEDLGAVILPTIINIKNGQAIGVTDDAQALAVALAHKE